MTRYTDEELEALLGDLESDMAERKESFHGDAPRTAREAVCAFANDLPDHRKAGVLFVGADDSGRPTGLPISDELLRQLADIKTDGGIVPPPTVTVSKRLDRHNRHLGPPNLAEALRVLGFIQRYGFGIPTARRELERNGNPPPEFDVQPTRVLCTVRARP